MSLPSIAPVLGGGVVTLAGSAAPDGRLQEYREPVLGVIFGVLLAVLTVLFEQVRFAGSVVVTLSVVAFFSAGLSFGLILWVAARRERATRRLHEAIASVNTVGVFVDDDAGKIVFANAKFRKMVGAFDVDILGKQFRDLIVPDSRPLADDEARSRALGASSVFETSLLRPDGQDLAAVVSAQSLMAGDKYHGSAWIVLDITARKRSEREVELAKELAEFFLDLITHDISNVHQGIRGFVELLASSPSMPEAKRASLFAKLVAQVDRANALITNVQKISQVRWAWRKAPTGSIDVEETVREAIALAMASFPDRQVEVAFRNDTGRVESRGDYLATELFYNLLHNAIKYTKVPRAEVGVEISRKPNGPAVVRIEDRGPGIPDAAKESLFARISPRSGERAPSGYHSGTGLTLVRLITERFGWRVWVEDRVKGDPSQGSAFCVEMLVA
jgi:PAS domain S-box-containing protein